MEIDLRLVDEDQSVLQLASLIGECTAEEFIALDTEFDREKTYYPSLALVQLKVRGMCYLVDPLKADISPVIKALVATPALILVFSGDEDLEVLVRQAQIADLAQKLPARICDLQLMSAFAGGDFQKGLQATLEQDLNICLDKSQTRSDWLFRPLSQEQLSYAACDVAFLEELHVFRLKAFKKEDVRLKWFYAAMLDKSANAQISIEPCKLYMSVSGAGELRNDQKALSRLRYLCQKRYEYGVLHNEALNRVITGKSLVSLAKFTPLTKQGLLSNRVHPVAVRQHGQDILRWIKESLGQEEITELLPPYDAFTPGRANRNRGSQLKHYLAQRAYKCEIREELLCTKKIINDYFYAHAMGTKSMLEKSWMSECVGNVSKAFKA